MTDPQGSAADASLDPLQRAEASLRSVATSPLERHPEIFGELDAHLREALEPAASPS